MSHEYQIVFIESNDGTHIFEIQLGQSHIIQLLYHIDASVLGSPFTIPTGIVPVSDARFLKVRNHALGLLFETPFTPNDWHNFAIQVNWTNLTLGVFYSTNANPLAAVTSLEDNSSAPPSVAGQGDYHFGVLKVNLSYITRFIIVEARYSSHL
jgi:hypothetical protein